MKKTNNDSNRAISLTNDNKESGIKIELIKKYNLFRLSILFLLFSICGLAFVGNSSNSQTKSDNPTTENKEWIGRQEKVSSNKSIHKKIPVYNEQTLADIDKPHTLVGAYFNVRNDKLKSKLMLNNKGLIPVKVYPTLFGVGGAMLQVPPVTIPPLSHQFVDIADWANLGGSGFYEGNLELFHTGKDLIIGSQIHLIDESKSLGFEYKIQERGQFDSRQLEAVWWNPSNNSEMDVVLTNTSEEMLTVTATLTKKPSVSNSPQTIVLLPRETKVLNVRDDFNQGKAFANKKILGLSVTHDGTFDSLLAWTMIKDESIGYSGTAIFKNPQLSQSKQFHGAGLQLGKIGNDKLRPVVIVRNISDDQVDVKVTVPYTKNNGNKEKVKIDTITLAPKEIHEVDMKKAKQLEDVRVAGIKIKHSGKKGSVIASAQSVSQSKTQVFKTLLWNVNSQHNSTGKYPLFIEDKVRTNAYIKNVSNRNEFYISFITWDAGGGDDKIYMMGANDIAPQETVEIDFKRIRDEQIPDENGELLPQDLTRGKLTWMLRRDTSATDEDKKVRVPLVGQLQQINTDGGINLTYFCSICCTAGPGGTPAFTNGSVSPGDASIEFGQGKTFTAYENGIDCFGQAFSLRAPSVFSIDWTSSASNVATVSNAPNSNFAYATSTGAGETEIEATWWVDKYIPQPPAPGCFPGGMGRNCLSCVETIDEVSPTADLTVTQQPTVTNMAVSGATKIVSITGNQDFIHFVTPKGGANDKITLTATISPNTEGIRDKISWEGANEDSSNPLKATISKANASKHVVKIKYNSTVIKEMRAWVVWASITSNGLAIESSRNGTFGVPPSIGTAIRGGYTFIHTINPSTIITDADRPNFSGVNMTNPPGGNHPIFTSDPLSMGANKKWDGSRQIRLKIISSATISNNDQFTPPFVNIPNYPVNDVEGNDDRTVLDETNDPYMNSGTLTGSDRPIYGLLDRAASNGDTFEARMHFRDFVRLEVEGTWHRISDYYLWRIHLKFIKTSGIWLDNNSNKALDNNGF